VTRTASVERALSDTRGREVVQYPKQ
jgi:hypothetical protein